MMPLSTSSTDWTAALELFGIGISAVFGVLVALTLAIALTSGIIGSVSSGREEKDKQDV